jgi:hypothetical protein
MAPQITSPIFIVSDYAFSFAFETDNSNHHFALALVQMDREIRVR